MAQQLPDLVTGELTRTGWNWANTTYGSGWICCQPATNTAAAVVAGGAR